jgi:hypothetical protein
MNEKGVTMSENNIQIIQIDMNIMPITFLSNTALQYSKSTDDVHRFLGEQKNYPSRLVFVFDLLP